MTLPPLPEPDTHCFDDDTGLDVWSHSPDQMHAYGEVCAAAERERCARVAEQQAECNGLALTHIEDAQNWLNRRTLERMRRGVEGTHKA